MGYRAGSFAAGEDIVQSAYERAIRYAKAIPDEEFAKWFNTILFNVFRDYQREERGYTTAYEDEEETSDNLECPHLPSYIVKEVQELIKTKSVTQIEVLELFFNYEYKAKDIAKVTQHSYVAIRKIISRFRQELRELYGT